MTTQSENVAEQWPFPDPRVAGVREHYERVKFFHALAEGCPDPTGKFRLLLAGVYSARAVVELIVEAVVDKGQEAPEKGQINAMRKNLKARLRKQIPWYDLIERVRIHDFHRFGLVPPDLRFRAMMLGGPVALGARKGTAIYCVAATGPKKLTTGNSEIREQRPLLSTDGKFFDDTTRQYISLDKIIRDFIRATIGTIREKT